MDHAIHHSDPARDTHELHVRKVELSAPLDWLRRGAADFRRSVGPSLGVGFVIAAAGLLLLAFSWQAAYAAPMLLGGFLLVAPFAAIAVYGVSRELERGDAVDIDEPWWRAWRANAGSIALYGLMLALSFIAWERLAAIVFASFYRGEPLHLARLPIELLSAQHIGLFAAFFGVGALLAAAVFAISVVTAPLLLERPVDPITAVLTSLRCCARNPKPMLLWAALIAVITAVGIMTLMLGLVVAFPLLAHASWHAYRDLVE